MPMQTEECNSINVNPTPSKYGCVPTPSQYGCVPSPSPSQYGCVSPQSTSLTLGDNETAVNCDGDYCDTSPLLAGAGHGRRSITPVALSAKVIRTLSRTTSSSEASTFSILTLSREQKSIIAVSCAIDLLQYLSVSIMAPFFPEEALKKNVSDTLSGWIFGTSPLVQFLVAPLFGRVVPHLGVKFVLLSGTLMSFGCTILFGLLSYVPTENGNGVFIALAFLLQVFKSLGVTATSTTSFVLLVQEFPDNVATVFGIAEIFVGLGLVAGPAVGGLLYGIDGFYLPFLTIGGLGLLSLPIMAFVVPQQTAYVDSGTEKIPLSKIFCSPLGFITSLTIVISTYMWSILDPTLEPYLRKFNLTPEMIGVIFLVMAAVYAMSAPVWGWLADKLEDQRGLLVLGFIGACVGSLLIGPSPVTGLEAGSSELWLVVVSLVILGASASLSSIPTFDMYFTLAEKLGFEDDTRTYSMVAGLWMSMYSLGDFLGPSIGGVLLDSVGFNNMCTYTAALCLLMAFFIVISWLCDLKCCKTNIPSIDSETSTGHDRINDLCDSFTQYGSCGNDIHV